MHIPTIERRGDDLPQAGGAGPLLSVPEEGVRLVPVAAPLAGLVVKGTLLSTITLGIYRFWYRTSLRRYYWSNTTLAGDGFEYTGTGKELFVGFLIALAIVLPLYFLVTLIGLVGGEILGPVIASILGALIMPAVVQILIYRARRYRLARTRYRGVRFHQTGTGIGYLLRTVKWLVLTALTLGIVFPYLRRALERYKTENTWYGSAQGAFSAPAKPLMKSWLLVWFIGMFAVGLGAISSVMIAYGAAGFLPFFTIVGIGAVIALPFAWIRYRIIEFRSFVGGTSFGAIMLSSDLGTGSVIWVWVRYYLILVGIGVGAMLAGWLLGIRPEPGMVEDIGEFLVKGPLVFLVMIGSFLSAVLATEILFRRRLWSLRAASISVTNLAALDQIVQTAGQDGSGVGDAFDTGFDIAG